MSLLRYYDTIRYLKTEQLCFQVYYKVSAKLRRVLGLREKYALYKKGNRLKFSSFPEKIISYKGDGTFEFLNLANRFCGSWDDRSLGDLWRYNLNYMDFILQPGMGVDEGVGWMQRFIDCIQDNSIAADPYPISLRGINWIKFISLNWDEIAEGVRAGLDASLYSQYRILYKRTERHLLANHYLENGFSLLFAAIYFQDKDFWQKANFIVERQLSEQIMNDGAHYELSPMYHCIILERVLDCLNLLQNAEGAVFEGCASMKNLLCEKACKMLSWLDAITVSGRIPLLNDSANGVALAPLQLRLYAESQGLKWNCGVLSDCGYRHIVRKDYEAVLDMAQLGVSYNLGHSHADSSTFLLWVNGGELVVDTGTSTYTAGERRGYERSTRAHNAVVIDSENSSGVWGAFRCAQRAQVVIEEDGPEIFTLRHDGYKSRDAVCRRSFVCGESAFEVLDTVVGKSPCVAEAYFHLAPEVRVLSIRDGRVVTDRAAFVFYGYKSVQQIEVEVANEYNILQRTLCIKVSFDSELHTIIDDFS